MSCQMPVNMKVEIFREDFQKGIPNKKNLKILDKMWKRVKYFNFVKMKVNGHFKIQCLDWGGKIIKLLK